MRFGHLSPGDMVLWSDGYKTGVSLVLSVYEAGRRSRTPMRLDCTILEKGKIIHDVLADVATWDIPMLSVEIL